MKVFDHFITVLGHRISIGIPDLVPYSEQVEILDLLGGAEESREKIKELKKELTQAATDVEAMASVSGLPSV